LDVTFILENEIASTICGIRSSYLKKNPHGRAVKEMEFSRV
jgi:hypothetical protein